MPDRCCGGVHCRRVFRGGTVTMGRGACIGVIDRRGQRNVGSRVRGKVRLIIPVLRRRAFQARSVALPDRCAGGTDRRRLFLGDTLNRGRSACAGVPDCRREWHLHSRGGQWNFRNRGRSGLAG